MASVNKAVAVVLLSLVLLLDVAAAAVSDLPELRSTQQNAAQTQNHDSARNRRFLQLGTAWTNCPELDCSIGAHIRCKHGLEGSKGVSTLCSCCQLRLFRPQAKKCSIHMGFRPSIACPF
ncbi:hypothetical protein O6H91_01G135700 [Diphasiastrum complanatum]|uniref:Uncharacterized protein n=1 Tax=Diphasiastrum complanatum TaxID=34168 RepID=A0ACC2EWL5_DIPCM|nr:hypothetical protein O6H91_01G135700 [Diphasiastrum complanatum]